MRVVSVSVTERGRALADQLPWEHHHGQAAATVKAQWHDVDGLVLFLATGAAVRIIAPLLADKHHDPAVVCVDEAGRFSVALCGGHAGGANELARTVAGYLAAEPVITTGSDSVGRAGLDQLPGFVAAGDVAAVATALLDGRAVRLDNPYDWPVPLTGDAAGAVLVTVTDHLVVTGPGQAVLYTPSLVAGVGTSSNAEAGEVADLLAEVLADAGLAVESLAQVATIDRRVDHRAIVALGYPIRAFPAVDLADMDVPTPSETVREAVGTPSVCEAAALLAAGPGAELVVAKRSGPTATVAIARRRGPRGHLALVGLGPGGAAHRTPAAEHAVRRAEVVLGYRAYLEQCADLRGPAQEWVASPIGDEVVRAKQALAEAGAGRQVALVCSGDSGIYGMASIVVELVDRGVDIDVIPGVTAATAGAAVLGAPLGHDHVALSLSDLLTSWEVIERRLRAAAQSDLVVSLYNPRSRGRTWQLDAARRILLEHRPPATPAGIVTDAGRAGECGVVTTLADLDVELVGMTSVVIIGSSTTTVVHGRMVTPRGYR
jgi:cobalt-precorrin 5A hydrolase/precorrin-3B C17-methyltransferase